MTSISRAEVHFYRPNQAAVRLECDPCGTGSEFQEILLFCCFAVEHLSRVGEKMASVATLIALLLINLRGNLHRIAEEESPGSPQVRAYNGISARKRFVADLTSAPDGIRFRLTWKGFAFLFRRKGYYATHSILVLLRYMARRRLHDAAYLAALSLACSEIGARYLRGEFSSDAPSETKARIIALRVAGKWTVERLRAVV
ncbi:MAG: hypothetical protein AB1733_09960 [Thermodesulfobacteriota bacterium]